MLVPQQQSAPTSFPVVGAPVQDSTVHIVGAATLDTNSILINFYISHLSHLRSPWIEVLKTILLTPYAT